MGGGGGSSPWSPPSYATAKELENGEDMLAILEGDNIIAYIKL